MSQSGATDSYREIPKRYFPEQVGPGGFDIDVMRAFAQATNRGYIYECPLKPWVVLCLLDRLQDAERLEAAIQKHLDTFGYDNHEGLADALAGGGED